MPDEAGKSRPGPADDSGMGESLPQPGNMSHGPLRSEFAGDAEMMQLVEFFVDTLQEKIGAIDDAWRSEDRRRLERLARQLKGAGGGYGFPSITEAAGQLERQLADDAADLAELADKVEALISLCRRASAES